MHFSNKNLPLTFKVYTFCHKNTIAFSALCSLYPAQTLLLIACGESGELWRVTRIRLVREAKPKPQVYNFIILRNVSCDDDVIKQVMV